MAPGALAAPTLVYFGSPSTNSIYGFTAGPGGVLAPLPGSVVASGADVAMLAFSPDGRSLYAADKHHDSTSIWQYDVAASGALSPKTPPTATAGEEPTAIAVSPDGRFAYSANLDSDNVTRFAVDADGALEPQGNRAVGDKPRGLAISPDGGSLYVTFSGGTAQFDIDDDGGLTPKTPAVNTVGAGHGLRDIQMTPAGDHVYIASTSGFLKQFDVGEGGVLAAKDPGFVDIYEDADCQAIGLALAPSVPSVHTGCVGPSSSSRNVSSFSVGADGALAPIQDLTVDAKAFWHAAVSPDGAHLYLAASLSGGLELDIGADGILTEGLTATPPHDAQAVAIRPWQGPTAAFVVSSATVGGVTVFDAGGSADPDGTIVRYDWDFGDGVTLLDGGPTPVHVYASEGTYTVTLTVTDDDGISTETVYTGQPIRNGGGGATTDVTVQVVTAPPPVVAGQAIEPKWEESVLIEPAGGSVQVKVPGAPAYVPLQALRELPEGTLVDARSGRARITSAPDASGGAQTADFYKGSFRVTYEGGSKAPVTQAELIGRLTCKAKKGGARASAATKKRRLWGSGKGRFRTRGRYGAGTVRGTIWLVEDRCDGTLTKVRRGSVSVRDFVLKKTLLLKAGKRSRYLARAPR